MCKAPFKKVDSGEQRLSLLYSHPPGSHSLEEPCPIPIPFLHQGLRTVLKDVSCEKSSFSLLFQVILIIKKCRHWAGVWATAAPLGKAAVPLAA